MAHQPAEQWCMFRTEASSSQHLPGTTSGEPPAVGSERLELDGNRGGAIVKIHKEHPRRRIGSGWEYPHQGPLRIQIGDTSSPSC